MAADPIAHDPPGIDALRARIDGTLGSFLAGDRSDRTGIRVREGDVNPRTGIRFILVAPYTSSGTDGEQAFDPSLSINFS